MRYSVKNKAVDAQNKHCKQKTFTDIHCHCLPGLDDGPRTMDEALALCKRLVSEGIATVVATPHQLGRFDGRNDATKVRDVTSRLNEQLQRAGIRLTILPGADVRVDERVCRLLEEDRILTIADAGKYILLELPHQIFIDVEPLLIELAVLGIKAIISHPERHSALLRQPKVILRWLDIEAYFQIDASSLLDSSGLDVYRNAWRFLSSGWASLVATDAHNTDERSPRMRAAFRQIYSRLGEDIADLVCIENPARIVNGLDIVEAEEGG
jgi:protein-tyrosine phosphatase